MAALSWKHLMVIGVLSNQLASYLCEDLPNLEDLPRSRVKRVIGGDDVEEGEWPWLIRLWGKVPSKTFLGIPISYTNFYCGGVIINERWAMTSAHCFTESDISSRRMLKPKYWHVKAGEIKAKHSIWDRFVGWIGRNIDKGSWAIWNLHTTKIVIHPDYDQSNFWANDIALVKLEKDLPLDSNPNIQKVRLSSFGENEGWPRVGGICVMKGWGCTASGGPQSSLAQAVELPIVATEKCDDLYNTKIGPKRLCAGYSLGEKGICRGDSGGPLVCQRTKGGPYFQEGIASFTASVNSGNYPGVFTRVSEYTDWIIKTIKE